jgi:hypothetical protein
MFSFIARESAHRPGGDGEGARSAAGAGGDGEDLVVGAGTVERVLVDRAAFLARAAGPQP